MIKKLCKPSKVGHTGTLDLEAEGVLPIAIGEATKLTSILVDSKKQYYFTIKFGAKTDTADASGEIIETIDIIPTENNCKNICKDFIGEIEQVPPAYSAIKVNGKRSYALAREGKAVPLSSRKIKIYDLQHVKYDSENNTASFLCTCSKGTYIRTLAEDISLCLQSLGFVIELRRLSVGNFNYKNAINISDFKLLDFADQKILLQNKCLKIEGVLDDIPVLDATEDQAQKIRLGQKCLFDLDQSIEKLWVRCDNKLVAIGSLQDRCFKSSRVFNL